MQMFLTLTAVLVALASVTASPIPSETQLDVVERIDAKIFNSRRSSRLEFAERFDAAMFQAADIKTESTPVEFAERFDAAMFQEADIKKESSSA